MKAGRLTGIILSVLGVPASIMAVVMLEKEGSVYKILLAGPAMLLVGLAMVAFPGGDITSRDLKEKSLWHEAPWAHRIAWLVAGAVGIALAFTLFFTWPW